MFEENIRIIKDTFSEYWGSGMYLVLFAIAILYLYLKEDNKKIRNLLIYFPIIILIVTLNPLFNKIIESIFTEHTYWRIFWMLPVGIVISYAIVKLLNNIEEKNKYVITCISIIMLLIISGKYMYTEENFFKLGNLYKIPDEKVLVTQLIGADNEKYKKAIVPETLVAYIRQIDSSILLAYPRKPQGYENNDIVRELNAGNVQGIVQIANKQKCNYIVFKKATVLKEKMEEYGFEKFNETENFAIYKQVTK